MRHGYHSIKNDVKGVFISRDFDFSCIEDKVYGYWDRLCACGRDYFNGNLLLVSDSDIWKDRDGNISVTAKKGEYAYFLYLRDHVRECKKVFARPLSCSTIIRTYDERYIIPKMGEHTAFPGKLSLIGGGIDVGDIREDYTIDFDHRIREEILEETGLDTKEEGLFTKFEKAAVSYVKNTVGFNIAYRTVVSITSKELIERYEDFSERLKKQGEIPEYEKVIVLEPDMKKIKRFLRSNSRNSMLCSKYFKLIVGL